MIIAPKNWGEFQHYKDRSPSWLKLHRSLLDNYEFHCLPVASRALAPMLWLLSSEHQDGHLDADPKKIAFRLRMERDEVADALKPLIDSGFFVVVEDDSSELADGYQMASLEKERETETETETEKEKEKETELQPLESSLRETPPVLVSPAKALKGPDPIARETWEAYASSYEARYGAKPVRNAKVNGQVAQLVKRLGDESPQVSEFYLTHNGQYYVQRMHDFGLLLSDAEKLRTEWATGSRMTATRARQTDSSQSNFDAAQQAKEMLRQKASHV